MKINVHNLLNGAVWNWKRVREGSAELFIETIDEVILYISYLLCLKAQNTKLTIKSRL